MSYICTCENCDNPGICTTCKKPSEETKIPTNWFPRKVNNPFRTQTILTNNEEKEN